MVDVTKTESAAQPGGEFSALMAEWETITKSLTADADEGGDGKKVDTDAGTKKTDADNKATDDVDGDAMFGKAFTVSLPDGTSAEAYDGTAMMKSLHQQNVLLAGRVEQLTADNGALVKAFTGATTVVKAQGELLKALRTDVDRIGSTGVGRRAALTLLDKKLAGEEPKKPGIDPKEFMAKAMTAFEAGKVTGFEVNQAESRLQHGTAPDESFVRKVLAHAG